MHAVGECLVNGHPFSVPRWDELFGPNVAQVLECMGNGYWTLIANFLKLLCDGLRLLHFATVARAARSQVGWDLASSLRSIAVVIISNCVASWPLHCGQGFCRHRPEHLQTIIYWLSVALQLVTEFSAIFEVQWRSPHSRLIATLFLSSVCANQPSPWTFRNHGYWHRAGWVSHMALHTRFDQLAQVATARVQQIPESVEEIRRKFREEAAEAV